MTPRAIFPDCAVKPKTFNAAICLPKDANNRCQLPQATILDPVLLITHLTQINGEAPDLIHLGAIINNRLETDEAVVAQIRDGKYSETRFPALGQYLRKAYAGQVEENAQAELQKVSMVRYVNGRLTRACQEFKTAPKHEGDRTRSDESIKICRNSATLKPVWI